MEGAVDPGSSRRLEKRDLDEVFPADGNATSTETATASEAEGVGSQLGVEIVQCRRHRSFELKSGAEFHEDGVAFTSVRGQQRSSDALWKGPTDLASDLG